MHYHKLKCKSTIQVVKIIGFQMLQNKEAGKTHSHSPIYVCIPLLHYLTYVKYNCIYILPYNNNLVILLLNIGPESPPLQSKIPHLCF